ncbi:MAG: N-6 DNA methylase [Rhodomicrobium sp.]
MKAKQPAQLAIKFVESDVSRFAMPNERTTEDIVRRHLQKFGVAGQIVEEQSSDDPKIRRALSKASKSNGGGGGKPEFIVRLKDDPDFLIVFECKRDATKHVSANRDKADAFAVDGVLHYSAHLSKSFDVIGVAISGTTAIRISTFRQLREAPIAEPLCDEHGPVERLLPVAEYQRLLNFDPAVRRRSHEELMQFGQELHDYLRDYAKLSENEKPLAVSGCLLALRDEAFKASWRKYKIKTLGHQLIAALGREIDAAVTEPHKQRTMLQPYQFLEMHPELNRVPPNETEWPLRALIDKIEEHVRPFLDTYRDIDVIGQFYGEFLRYTGGDKKGLGIVLTPRHLTELFVKMARVGVKDTVLDTCCGTGGFLIAALAEMDAKADGDPDIREDIRKHRLVGVEQQPQMFALAASNMILRGDGKANLFQGNCFDPELIESLEDPEENRFRRPTIGLINPPFSQQGEGLHELNFVVNLLDILAPGGRAVVVVPMSCAIESHPIREKLLENHTLIAAVTLPPELFHPIGVVTCGLMFEAHQPHADSPSPTWFGSWKSDGFVKQKHRGRVDPTGHWPQVRDAWLKSFHARATIPGQSISRHVDANDEWCAEAYMETDYSTLTQADLAGEAFLQPFPYYCGFHVMVLTPKITMTEQEKLWWVTCITANRFRFGFGRQANRTLKDLVLPEPSAIPRWVAIADTDRFNGADVPAITEQEILSDPKTWRQYILQDLFDIRKGKRLTKADMKHGSIPFIGAIDSNNGVSGYIGQIPIHSGGTITISYNGSVAETFYQPVPFWATDDVNVLYPKFEMTPAHALFLCAIIRQEKFRYNYGRKWHLDRMRNTIIRLPATSDGKPDWRFMERYVLALPFSSQLAA